MTPQNLSLEILVADGVTEVKQSANYDPTQKQKHWTYQPPAGSDPNDMFVYKYPNGSGQWLTWAVLNAQAPIANIPPIGYEGPEALGVVPIPMDPAKIPAGYSLVGTPFGLELQPNAPAPATDVTEQQILVVEQEILAGEREIEQKEGLPQT